MCPECNLHFDAISLDACHIFVVILHQLPSNQGKVIQGLPRITCINPNNGINKMNKLTLHMQQPCAHDPLWTGIPVWPRVVRYIASTELRYLWLLYLCSLAISFPVSFSFSLTFFPSWLLQLRKVVSKSFSTRPQVPRLFTSGPLPWNG